MTAVADVAAKPLDQSWVTTLGTDPAPGDVLVFVATGANNSSVRNLTAVSGLGATWDPGEFSQYSASSEPSVHVAVGRGADMAAGNLTATFSLARYGIGRLYVVRGLTDAVVTWSYTRRTASTSVLAGPATDVDAGDVLINVLVSNLGGPSTTWTRDAAWTLDPAGIESRDSLAPLHTAGTAYQLPTGPATLGTSGTTSANATLVIGSIRVRGAGAPPPASSALHLGAADVTALYLGAAPVAAAYLGATPVYTAP